MRRPEFRRIGKGLATTCLVLFPACMVAGCVETTASIPPAAAEPPTNMARREGVSPRGASVAMESLAGVPPGVADRFKAAFGREAEGQDIALADSKKAKYLVRGYLNAYPAKEGTAVAMVLDVFDAKKRRAQRVDDVVLVKGGASDPWSVVDDKVLADVASRSAADLAAFLTNTPEALVAANSTKPSAGTTKVAAARPAARNETTVQMSRTAEPPVAPPPSPAVGVAALR